MASIALSVVGFAVGGPLGAAIGSIIGQQLDPLIFGSGPAREGPRIKELDVQTSSYGTAIPRLYGRMRVAGTVIWSTDLRESKRTQGAKGQPDIVTYSYSASFAVALSSRPIIGVGRIWADGKLIRGTDNRLKVEGGFRTVNGRGDRAPDPLIAAAEGSDRTPAHRGIAYALFEDLQLAEFGNRIPSLTFEVIADQVAIDARLPLHDIGGIEAGAEANEPLIGYAAEGTDRRAALAPLLAALPIRVVDRGDGRLVAIDSDADPEEAVSVEPLAASGDGSAARVTSEAADRLPRRVALRHYDPARDYQAGLQQRDWPGGTGRETRIELPAVVDAASALRLATRSLDHARRQRDRWQGRIALPDEPLIPGSVIRPAAGPGAGREWRLMTVEHAGEQLIVEAAGLSRTRRTPMRPADSGRASTGIDLPVPPTRAVLVELPAIDGMLPTAPRLVVAGCGDGPGWRGAAVAVRRGDSLFEMGSLPRGAVVGTAMSALAANRGLLFDRASDVEVQLADGASGLADADAAALDAGANLALLGREVLQFGDAVPLGGGRWRLSSLRRAVRGDFATAFEHTAGEPFLLLDPAALLALPPGDGPGATVTVEIVGLGDAAPLVLSRRVAGDAIRPLAPVHCRIDTDNGVRTLSWIRRSRLASGWLDGADLPLGEERERYRIEWASSGVTGGSAETDAASFILPPDIGGSATITIVQLGSHAASMPLTIIA